MWHSRTSKQCLRLGAGEYRDRGRESATNPNTGNAYPYTCGDSVRAGNANTYTDFDAYSYTNVDAYSYTNGNAYSERDSDSDTYAYGLANSLAYSYAQGYTKGSANSAPSADTAVRDRER